MSNYTNLEHTIIEVTDDELSLIRLALERFKQNRPTFSHGETDIDSVLELINEAFHITEEYRLDQNPEYLTEMQRVEIEAQTPFVLLSAYTH